MKVCLIGSQAAAFGKIGGFGSALRAIGRGLSARGVEVSAVVPRRPGQRALEALDGIAVHGLSAWSTLTSGRVFRSIGADVYHSQEPTLASFWAQRAAPLAVHVVTCRDPRSLGDHVVEWRHASARRRLSAPGTWLYEASPWVRRAVRRADAVFCAAPHLVPKVRRLYGASLDPIFLPSPVELPSAPPVKAAAPTVLFVGRWDGRKRVERFFELARVFPGVRFVAVGRAPEPGRDRRLRALAATLPNLEAPGFLSRFGGGLERLYAEAWVLANTSVREGLPYTFVEAAAFGCALLAGLDPDGFASRFGRHAADGDFESGLRFLLEQDRWRALGQAGARHVAETFSEERSLEAHLAHYRRLLAARP